MIKGRVSIIMPAFNAALRIENSVRIIEEQTYEDFELIIVNDGSQDETKEICEELADEFGNIIVLTQDNAGPGKARETGLASASGEFITFVDSDDYIDCHLLEKVIKVFNDNAVDIVQFGYIKIDGEGKLLSHNPMKREIYNSADAAFGYFIAQKNCTNFLWNKVYKYTLFHGVMWPDIYYSEDYVVLAQLYGHSRKVITIEDELYYYVQHSESAVNQPFNMKKLGQVEAGRYVVEYTRVHFPTYLPEALLYIVSRTARLSQDVMSSKLPDKSRIYQELVHEFKTTYDEMKNILKEQNRKIYIDKTTRVFAISPRLARLLKR